MYSHQSKYKGKCIICCKNDVSDSENICDECKKKYKTTYKKIEKRLKKLGYI